jgi:hypothetical protein
MREAEPTIPIEAANVKRIERYVNVVRALLGVLNPAAEEPGLWPRARCQAILADCRKRYVARMRQVSHMDQTECDVGFDLLYDFLWDLLHPADHATHTELICRIKKARWVVMALERGLSAIGVLENVYPAGREALSHSEKTPSRVGTQ